MKGVEKKGMWAVGGAGKEEKGKERKRERENSSGKRASSVEQ